MYLVIGATGNVGRHVVSGLVGRGQKVRALSRDRRQATALLGDEVEVLEGDLADPAAVRAALAGVDGAFVAMTGSPQQPALERAVVDEASRVSLPRLVKVSVIGASPEHFVRYARWQGDIESHLAASGVPSTILRPSWFDENFLGSAATITGQGALYGSAGDGRVGFVDSRDIAAVAVATLTEDGHAGREYVVTGPVSMTFTEAAEHLAAGLERSVSYVDLTDEQLREALLGVGLPQDVGDDVVAINRNAREGGLDVATTTVMDLTGSPARPLEQWARDHRAAFSPPAAS